MSHTWLLSCCLPKANWKGKVLEVLTHSYAYGVGWQVRLPDSMTISDVEDTLLDFEDFEQALRFRIVRSRPEGANRNDQWLALIIRSVQDIGGKDIFVVQLELPTSIGIHTTSRRAWPLVEDAIKILQPFFAFSSDYADHIGTLKDSGRQDVLDKPWRYWWHTMLYGKHLFNQIDADTLRHLELNAYYYKVLGESILWLSSPMGLGNEAPYLYQVDDGYTDYWAWLETLDSQSIQLSG